MLKEQFDIAVAETKIRTPNLIEAARAVLVDGISGTEAAVKFGIHESSHVYKATVSIQRKWDEICKKESWVFLPIALPERMMRIVLEIQAQEFEDYERKQGKRKRSLKAK